MLLLFGINFFLLHINFKKIYFTICPINIAKISPGIFPTSIRQRELCQQECDGTLLTGCGTVFAQGQPRDISAYGPVPLTCCCASCGTA